MELIIAPHRHTYRLGGVDIPAAAVLEEMHAGQYILRAVGGQLIQVAVEKVLLPHSNNTSPQAVQVDRGAGGLVYVRQPEVLCTSTDGGRSWTARALAGIEKDPDFRWKLLADGTFISVECSTGEGAREPAVVWVSSDAGRTWSRRAEIAVEMNLPKGGSYSERYTHRGLERLSDDTLLWFVDVRDAPVTADGLPADHGCYCFQSRDGGHTWRGPILLADWGSEGGATLLPSGRVFATLRYQRMPLPSDTGAMYEPLAGNDEYLETFARRFGQTPQGFKNLFVMESEDRGLSWTPPRMLCTAYGQTFGYPAAQSDGTVAVIHDTRYGPGPPGARALISRDEGQTWEDEVYYMDATAFTGSYSASVVLDDDTILSICASSRGASWEEVRDDTDLYAIRWRPQ